MRPPSRKAPSPSREEYDRRQRAMSELGLVLLLVGAALAVAEAHVPSHGALGSAAVAAAATGSRS